MAKSINFNIRLNVDGKEQLATATANVKDLKKAVEQSKTASQNAFEQFNNLGFAVGNLGTAISSLQGMMQNLASGYQASVQANTQLTTVMRQRMNATDEDIAKVKETIAAQKQLGVIGGVVQMRGAQQIATFLTEKNTLNTLIPAMNNLLAQQKGLNATQEDAYGVANLMGKAMQGQTSALKRVGITFSDAEAQVMQFGTEQQRAAMLAQIITNNVGKMNEELGKTDMGKQKQMENQFAAIKVKIGEIAQQGLPFVSFGAQSLSLLTSLVSLSKGIKAMWAAFTGLNAVMRLSSVVTAGARTAYVSLSATTKLLSATFTGASVGATTLKFAIRGLLVSTGVGIAIVALTEGIQYLMSKSSKAADSVGELSAAEMEAKQAHQQEQQEIANVTSQLDINISKLKNFKGSKAEEKKLVGEMNTTYGEAMGYYSTVAQWYQALTANSKTYCNQMINEIRIRNLANDAANLDQQMHDVVFDGKGKARKYSDKVDVNDPSIQWEKITDVKKIGKNTQMIRGANGEPVYYNPINPKSQASEAKDKYDNLRAQRDAKTRQMNALVKQNSSTSYKKLSGYSPTLPSASGNNGGGRKNTPKGTPAKDEKEKPLEGSLDWYEDELQKIRKEIQSTADEGVAKAKQVEYEQLDKKYKDLKVKIGIEKPEVKEEKTILEQLQSDLQDAQKDFENTSPLDIKAKVEALAKVSEIQSQIDQATKGEVSIKANVEPSYIVKGSVEDKRQSYSNAQQKASRVQSDFDTGIIDKAEAQRQIDEINKEISAVGENLKPVKIDLDVDKEAVEAIKNLGNIDLSNMESVKSAIENIKAVTDPTAKGFATAGAACSALGGAMQQLGADSAAAKAGLVMAAIGQIALSFAQALSSCKTWIEWLAFGISGTAQMISLVSTVSGFATGGIVGGNSPSGDKIPIRVNSGEMVLNKSQQARLFALANGSQKVQGISLPVRQQPNVNVNPSVMAQLSMPDQSQQTVRFKIDGRTLVGVLANETRISSRSGRRTNIQI